MGHLLPDRTLSDGIINVKSSLEWNPGISLLTYLTNVQPYHVLGKWDTSEPWDVVTSRKFKSSPVMSQLEVQLKSKALKTQLVIALVKTTIILIGKIRGSSELKTRLSDCEHDGHLQSLDCRV